jgi:hypothetical protein
MPMVTGRGAGAGGLSVASSARDASSSDLRARAAAPETAG